MRSCFKLRTALLVAAVSISSILATAVSTPGAVSARSVRISVTQTGTWPPYRGLYLVSYPSSGSINGTAGATQGTAVELLANPFPFKTGFHTIARTTTGPQGAFRFGVSPTIATRYRVALATDAAVSSSTITFYLIGYGTGSSTCSTAPTCVLHAMFEYHLSKLAAAAELRKKSYIYVGVTQGSRAVPAILHLVPSAHVTIQSVGGTLYRESFTLSMSVGTGTYDYQWSSCSIETERSDGWGVPIHTGCGAATVTRAQESSPYFG